MKNCNVGATHTGAFREWKEDFETVEIFLPLPPATAKRELVCVITPDSLHISTVFCTTLLVAQPLAGPVIPEESTWWLEDGVLNLVLAKQWRGETKSDQYWGAQLAAKGGTYECYMPPAQVRAAKQAREREEAELAQERHARIKKADAAAKAARAAEAAEAEAEAARRRDAQVAALQAARRRRAAGQPGDDVRRSGGLRDGETRKPRPRAQPSLASKRLPPPRAASHQASRPNGGIARLLYPPAPEWLLRRLRARLHTCKRGLSRSPAQGATRSASRHRRLRSSHFPEQATGGHELEGIRRRVHRRARAAAAEPVEAGRARHHIWRGRHGGGEPLGRGGPRKQRVNDYCGTARPTASTVSSCVAIDVERAKREKLMY